MIRFFKFVGFPKYAVIYFGTFCNWLFGIAAAVFVLAIVYGIFKEVLVIRCLWRRGNKKGKK